MRRIEVIRLLPVLDFGGVESRAVLLAQHHDRERFALRVCTFWRGGAAADRIRAAGISVDELGVDPSIRNPYATAALAKYLLGRQVDILHASIGEANFHAALMGRFCGAGGVIMEEAGIPHRRAFGRLVHAVLYRCVDKVIGVSKASCDYIINEEFAPLSKVFQLYNTISPSFFELPPRRDHRSARFFTAGRLVAVKNHELLLRAFRDVREQIPHATLDIAGDGPLRARLQQLIESLGLASCVTLLGFQAELSPLLDQSDFFVLPSLSEGFGLALVEAMARGCAPLATCVGGAAEIVSPLGVGCALAPSDQEAWTAAMVRLARLDPAQREVLSVNARARAEDFSPDIYITKLQSLYGELAKFNR